MKIFKENKCYVEVEDLLRFPLPRFIKLPANLTPETFVEFETEDVIKYFKGREDIVDYNSVCDLSIKEINKKMKEIREKLEKLSLEWLESSYECRIELAKNQEYQNSSIILKAIYQSLRKYVDNKKSIDFSMRFIELNQECKKYPRIQLGGSGQSIHNFSVEDFAEDGFIENYCLSDAEKNEVNKSRKTKQLTMHEQLDDFLMNAK